SLHADGVELVSEFSSYLDREQTCGVLDHCACLIRLLRCVLDLLPGVLNVLLADVKRHDDRSERCERAENRGHRSSQREPEHRVLAPGASWGGVIHRQLEAR